MKHQRMTAKKESITTSQFSRQRITVLVLGFLCLGLFSACSEVQREVIDSKQSSAMDRSKTFGRGHQDFAANRSLWNLNHKDVN